ncbi:MAG: hypothetical protein ABI874_09655, partial [Chloroflexota bacterium]
MNDRLTQQIKTRSGQPRVGAREFVVAESPIPQQRALTARRPLALVLGGSATVMAIWFLAVIGSAGMAATGGAAVVMQGSVPNTQRDTTINVPNANIIPQNPQNKPSLPPPLLQSRSADTLPPLTARSDGRTALRASPSVLVVYVPDGYYPPPQSAQPPTKEAAQQTANIVQELATGNETKAVEQAKVLQAAQPQYAKTVAVELQTATQDSPRYNVVRQTLIALDPALATRA